MVRQIFFPVFKPVPTDLVVPRWSSVWGASEEEEEEEEEPGAQNPNGGYSRGQGYETDIVKGA